MSSLEDKILGEKLQYYCSSSEDEGEDDEEECGKGSEAADGECSTKNPTKSTISCPQFNESDGYSVNTGPKGVIKDWQRYKQLEVEAREEADNEKLQLIKKMTLNCRPYSEEQKEEQIDEEIDRLLSTDDMFLKQYMRQRMEEMMKQIKENNSNEEPLFGSLIHIRSGDEFLQAIDKERKSVTIICHIYNNDIAGCAAMNGCLLCLAQQYRNFKFCSIEASSVGMSKHFEKSGVPALLVYKGGNLLGNFVRLTDEFGDEFLADDVRRFLVEHGFLPDDSLIPQLIMNRSSIRQSDINDDDDSE